MFALLSWLRRRRAVVLALGLVLQLRVVAVEEPVHLLGVEALLGVPQPELGHRLLDRGRLRVAAREPSVDRPQLLLEGGRVVVELGGPGVVEVVVGLDGADAQQLRQVGPLALERVLLDGDEGVVAVISILMLLVGVFFQYLFESSLKALGTVRH